MAEPQISPQVQQQLQQLQALNQQFQAMANQRGQMEAILAEQQQAIEALEALADDAPVYRNVGSLLMREPSKAAAITRLKDDNETLEVRLTRSQKAEATMKEQLTALQAKIQAALPKA